jgi:hypothetical protein
MEEEEENEIFYNYKEVYEMRKLTWVRKNKTPALKAVSNSTEME